MNNVFKLAGNCFSRQKLHSQAVEQLEKACRLHPRFQYAFTLLGHEYANNEELERAMQVYRRALAVNANSYLVWSGLASVYMKQVRTPNVWQLSLLD